MPLSADQGAVGPFYNKLTVMYSDRPEFIKLAVNFFPIIGVLFLGFNAFAQEPFYQTDDFLYQAKQKVINIRKDAKNKKYIQLK